MSEALARHQARAGELGDVEHQARAELAVVDHLIGERERLALAAIRLSPSPYILAELGERPSDPDRRMAWDRTAVGIEDYRRSYGVRDRDSALADRPAERMQRAAWESRQRELERTQRQLGRARTVERDVGLEIGL